MEIKYKTDFIPDTVSIIALLSSSGINRPTGNPDRIGKMYANSSMVVTAWQKDNLVGVARCLTDYCYSCYLADLAVHADYQQKGIGRGLLRVVKDMLGESVTIVLISAPGAETFYPSAGFESSKLAFVQKRRE